MKNSLDLIVRALDSATKQGAFDLQEAQRIAMALAQMQQLVLKAEEDEAQQNKEVPVVKSMNKSRK